MVLHEYYKLLKRKIRSKKAVVSQLRDMGRESRTAASKIIKQTRTIFILFSAICDSVSDAENFVAPELEF